MYRQNSTRHETEQDGFADLAEARWKEMQAGLYDLHLDIAYRDPRDVDPIEDRSRLAAAEAAYLRGY